MLGVTASGPDLASAIDAAYNAVRWTHFEGMHYRRDIGRKGIVRWSPPDFLAIDGDHIFAAGLRKAPMSADGVGAGPRVGH